MTAVAHTLRFKDYILLSLLPHASFAPCKNNQNHIVVVAVVVVVEVFQEVSFTSSIQRREIEEEDQEKRMRGKWRQLSVTKTKYLRIF